MARQSSTSRSNVWGESRVWRVRTVSPASQRSLMMATPPHELALEHRQSTRHRREPRGQALNTPMIPPTHAEIAQRNAEMRQRYASGWPVKKLCGWYRLSIRQTESILYGNKS